LYEACIIEVLAYIEVNWLDENFLVDIPNFYCVQCGI
jgi:hypothetical protein